MNLYSAVQCWWVHLVGLRSHICKALVELRMLLSWVGSLLHLDEMRGVWSPGWLGYLLSLVNDILHSLCDQKFSVSNADRVPAEMFPEPSACHQATEVAWQSSR